MLMALQKVEEDGVRARASVWVWLRTSRSACIQGRVVFVSCGVRLPNVTSSAVTAGDLSNPVLPDPKPHRCLAQPSKRAVKGDRQDMQRSSIERDGLVRLLGDMGHRGLYSRVMNVVQHDMVYFRSGNAGGNRGNQY